MDERYGQPEPLSLTGTVKNLIFQNQENGYTVLRLDVGGDEPITVVGCLPYAAPGEGLTVEGVWERHPSHGEQFKAESAERHMPVGADAVYEYLAGGAVKGIGPKTAQRLILELKDKVAKGEDTPSGEIFKVVDNQAVEEATQALVMLGFAKPAITKAVRKITAEKPDAKVEEIIKSALQLL